MAEGPDAGLTLIDGILESGALSSYHLLYAARADLHRRAHRYVEAEGNYLKALELTQNGAEIRFLKRRLEEMRMAYA